MEFLTLQDVPRYHHRSAMTLRECSPLRYPARQQEAAERMKVGTAFNPTSHSFLRFTEAAAPLPASPLTTSSRSPSPCLQRCEVPPLQYTPSPTVGDRNSPGTPPEVHQQIGNGGRRVICEARNGLHALSEAGERCQLEDAQGGWNWRELKQLGGLSSSSSRLSSRKNRTLPPPPRPLSIKEWKIESPKPEMLTVAEPHPQTSAQLPSFKELLDSTASSPDSQSAHIKSSPASSDHHWQTSSARASRQSSAERPVFHDPFRGVPPPSLPSRSSTQHARPGPSTENYTTQIDVRPSLLQARPPTNYDSRRTSLRADYEPRIPSEPRGQSLPSLFNSSRVGPAETVVPNTIHNVYHASNSYSAGPITEVARYSEPVYASVAYPGEHHPHRPPYVSEHTRASMRHDSSVFPAHEHHWPPTAYAYGQGYGYVPEHHNGMDNYPGNRRRRGNLPKEATALLKKWFQDHAESPYPSDEEKNQLAMATGLTSAQISNWFINARRRNPGKEARELARAMNSNRNSCQQLAQGASSTQDQDLSVHTSTSPPQQQSRHAPQQQHHEQRYSLPQITSSKYPYDPRDHQHDRDHDMGNA